MTIPFDIVFSIFQYLGKEPYIHDGKTYLRFTRDFLHKHPSSNLRREVFQYSSNIVLELHTNVNKCIKPLNFIGKKVLYYNIYLDNRTSYKFEHGYTILHDVAGQIYRKINHMAIINPIRHMIMNFECNKN
jgi:hypothetical protein